MFWQVIQEIANNEHMTTSQFIEKLYDEVVELRGEITNFALFFWGCCVIYKQNGNASSAVGALDRGASALGSDRLPAATVLPLR